MKQPALIEVPRVLGPLVSFRVPYPPSANRLYAWSPKTGPYKTAEHRKYLGAVSNALRVAALRNRDVDSLPFKGRVALTVRLFRPIKRGDIDNPLKALFDSLIGRPDEEHCGAWVDDSQVCELHLFMGDDKDDPRVELEIGEFR